MNLQKRQYICKIYGISLLKPSQSLEFTIYLQISVKEKAVHICFLKTKMKKPSKNYRYIISKNSCYLIGGVG
jgi:hypothetical protein